MMQIKKYFFPITALCIIMTTMTFLWLDARPKQFLNCEADCGETLIAINVADAYAKNGDHHAFLERLGGTDEHPKFYTHNVNIGALSFTALEAMGVHSNAGKALLPFCAFALGLFFVFLCVELFTNSALAGLITLLVFATTYSGNLFFAFNALRAWHILALFGVLYYVGKLCKTSDTTSFWKPWLGLTVMATIAFGCGYDFWVPCGAVALMALFFQTPSSIKLFCARLVLIGVAFTIPFILRQLQIIYALGLDYWTQDMYYSLAIKIPHAADLLPLPSMDAVDAFYSKYSVSRPPASPSSSFKAILETFTTMVSTITIPRWGLVTVVTFATMLVFSIWIRFAIFRNLTKRVFGAVLNPPLERFIPEANLLLPVFLGITLGIIIFAPFSLHVYFKHEFPLIGFILMLAKGLAIYSLILMMQTRRTQLTVAICSLLFVFFAVDAVMVRNNNRLYAYGSVFSWVPFINEHSQQQFLLSWHPIDGLPILSVASIPVADPANAFATIKALRERKLNRPDYWVYQPDRHSNTFDAVQPTCQWQDWILRHRHSKPVVFSNTWITPNKAMINGAYSFGAHIQGLDLSNYTLTLETNSKSLSPIKPIYNCIYKNLTGWVQLKDEPEKEFLISLLITKKNNISDNKTYKFVLPKSAEGESISSVYTSPPPALDPSIETVIAAAPDFMVVEKNDRHVIFKLPD
jgi:hypothetical protein